MRLGSGAILGCFIPLLLWGCSSPEPSATPDAKGPSASAVVAPGGSAADSTAASASIGRLSLTLQPSRPTILEDLEAHVSGAVDAVTFRWEKNGVPLVEQTGSRLPSGLTVRGDLVAVIVSSVEGEARAQITIVNSLPRVERVRLKEPRVHRGVDMDVEVQGVDLDGDPLTYRYVWQVNGEDLHWEQGPVLAGDKFRRGDKVVLQVTPNDGKENGPAFQGLEMTIPNAPPKFVSQPPQQFQGPIYQYQVKAEDPDGDQLTYSLESGPKGMQFDPVGGLLTWTLAKSDSGAHRLRLLAKDPEGLEAYQEYTMNLTIPQ